PGTFYCSTTAVGIPSVLSPFPARSTLLPYTTLFRSFSRQRNHLRQIVLKSGPVVRRALAAPGVLTPGGSQRNRLYQLSGQQGGMLPAPLHGAQADALPFIQWFLLGGGKPVGQLRSGGLLMNQRSEERRVGREWRP